MNSWECYLGVLFLAQKNVMNERMNVGRGDECCRGKCEQKNKCSDGGG